MKIAFVGDVHGCVRHALQAVAALPVEVDAVIQVGDLGAYPSSDRFDAASRRFAQLNPEQNDFFRLLDPDPHFAADIRRLLERVPPVLFVSGNHEDHEWLGAIHAAAGTTVTPVDPLGAFHHVECGSVLDVRGLRVAFLGLIEAPGRMDYDAGAYERLSQLPPGSADILVTHDGPYGMSRSRHGDQIQGSPKLTRLIEHLQPRLHVSGHYHHVNGPRRYGRTTSYALAQLRPATPGGVALLDTETDDFTYAAALTGW